MSIVGKMRDRLEIQTSTLVDDDWGGKVPGWKSKGVIWGEIMPMNAHERFMAMQLEEKITHKIMIRYTPNLISRGDRIITVDQSGPRSLEVEAVMEMDNKKRWMKVMAREIPQDG